MVETDVVPHQEDGKVGNSVQVTRPKKTQRLRRVQGDEKRGGEDVLGELINLEEEEEEPKRERGRRNGVGMAIFFFYSKDQGVVDIYHWLPGRTLEGS